MPGLADVIEPLHMDIQRGQTTFDQAVENLRCCSMRMPGPASTG